MGVDSNPSVPSRPVFTTVAGGEHPLIPDSEIDTIVHTAAETCAITQEALGLQPKSAVPVPNRESLHLTQQVSHSEAGGSIIADPGPSVEQSINFFEKKVAAQNAARELNNVVKPVFQFKGASGTEHKQIAAGKAKRVLTGDDKSVYLIPHDGAKTPEESSTVMNSTARKTDLQKSAIEKRTAELKYEVAIAAKMKTNLLAEGVKDETNLNINLIEVEAKDAIEGLYTVKNDKGTGDLDDLFKKQGEALSEKRELENQAGDCEQRALECKQKAQDQRGFAEQAKAKGAQDLAEVFSEAATALEAEAENLTAKALEFREKAKTLPFPTAEESLDCVKQIANGAKNVHLAGMALGDPKPDNVMVYDGPDGKKIYRLSDWGKTSPIKPGERALYTGNTRYVPPEGGKSQQGDVYSMALIMIRVLEEPLLQEGNKQALVDIPSGKKKAGTFAKENERRGVEHHMCYHKDTKQRDLEGAPWKSKVETYASLNAPKMVPAVFRTSPPEGGPEQVVIYKYIDAMVEGLIVSGRYEKEEAKKLGNLLKGMTVSDPRLRPTMESIVAGLGTIQTKTA